MPRLGNPLVFDLLEIAAMLAKQGGRTNFKQAAARRAVSTAYYAVFHALCTVCATELVGSKRADLAERTYRSLDHAVARRRLGLLASRAGIKPGINRLGVGFGELQDKRHLADYAPSGSLFSSTEAGAEVDKARDMIAILEGFTRDERRALAIELLVTKPR